MDDRIVRLRSCIAWFTTERISLRWIPISFSIRSLRACSSASARRFAHAAMSDLRQVPTVFGDRASRRVAPWPGQVSKIAGIWPFECNLLLMSFLTLDFAPTVISPLNASYQRRDRISSRLPPRGQAATFAIAFLSDFNHATGQSVNQPGGLPNVVVCLVCRQYNMLININ